MSAPSPDHTTLDACLRDLDHLRISEDRLTDEPNYGPTGSSSTILQAIANTGAAQQQQQHQASQQSQQQQSRLQFNPGKGQQQPPPLASQIPGLGQMGQSATGVSNGQQQPPAQGPPQSNGMDGAAFLEQFVNLPVEAYRNQLVNFKNKIKALEEQRDRLLQIKTPQMIEQAQRVQAQLNGLQNVMQQLIEAYTRRQAMNLQQAAAGGPSGQQGERARGMGGQTGSNPTSIQNRPGMPQGPQDGLTTQHRQMEFHQFFTNAFNSWLSQRQLTLDPPRVDGKEVELPELFLMVGALGGCRAVFEKKLWPVVGAKVGFPYFNGTIPYSKPEVAEQLSKIYQKILADFEVHWHNSLRPRDPNSIFPLPTQLQYLRPEIERLATTQLPLPQPQQTQRPLGAWPQQPPGLGPAVGNSLQPSALPPQPGAPQLQTTVAGLNVSPEQLAKAQEKVRAAIGLFHNKRDYSSINLSHEQGILLEQSIQQTESLLKQVAQNLVPFVVLAPNNEQELNQVAQTVVTLADQAQILRKQPPEKRFIFGLGDLNQYRNHLTTFLMRAKGLQSQAMALQSQQASGALPPGLPHSPPTILLE